MASYDRRTQYIGDLISLEDIKVTRIRKEGSNKKRTNTAYYHFRIKNTLIRTCKGCFLKTFDITTKFIEVVILKKRNSLNISGVLELDRRGSHTNRNKISSVYFRKKLGFLSEFDNLHRGN